MKQQIKIYVSLILLVFMISSDDSAMAQTYQFSQYYNSFQLLNPSYTGITGHRYRIGTISRLQWIGVPSQSSLPYSTMAVFGSWIFAHPQSNNQNLGKHSNTRNSFYSAGFAVIQNNQANGALKSNTVMTSVSWVGRLGQDTYLSGGGEFNFNSIKLSDYVRVSDYLQGNNLPQAGEQVQYPNFSLGLTMVHKRLWLGVSIKDILASPSVKSFYTQDKGFYDQFNVHGGYSTRLKGTENLLLTSSFSFKTWNNLKQLEAGLGFVRAYQSGYSWSTTIAYRGYPIESQKLSNDDALIAILSFNSIPNSKKVTEGRVNMLGNTSISISSDFYSFQFGSAFSTWELSLTYNAPYKKQRIVYCEDYLHGPMAEQITRNLYSGTPPFMKGSKRKSFSEQPAEDTGPRKRKRKSN